MKGLNGAILMFLGKQSFGDVLQNTFSQKFRKFHRKTPVLESIFNKLTGLHACNFIKKDSKYRSFPVKLTKFLKAPLCKTPPVAGSELGTLHIQS